MLLSDDLFFVFQDFQEKPTVSLLAFSNTCMLCLARMVITFLETLRLSETGRASMVCLPLKQNRGPSRMALQSLAQSPHSQTEITRLLSQARHNAFRRTRPPGFMVHIVSSLHKWDGCSTKHSPPLADIGSKHLLQVPEQASPCPPFFQCCLWCSRLQ